MRRSHLSGTLVRIGLFVTMGFFAVQLGLVLRAEATPKSDPVAVVGPDFQVMVGETVTADGRLSYDPQGKKLHFKWELIQVPPGSSAKLLKKNSPIPSFTADKHGRYIIELRVSNNGIKWSDSVLLTVVATGYPQNALVSVNTRLVKSPTTTNPLSKYNIQVGETYYTAPPYKAGTETSTPTGFQVLVLERDTLLPATQFTYHQSFSGTPRGYIDMISFLKSLTDKGLLVIISPFDDTRLDRYFNQAVELAAIIQNLGGTENFLWTLKAPQDVYSLIGIPGIGAGNGIEMCGWDHYGLTTTAAIQGIFTRDKYSNFQFIYPNFTSFETKSWADSAGNFSGSVKLGSKEAIYGGKLPSGQGAFQVVYFRRDNADWSSESPESSVWYTNVPGFESMSVKSMVAQLKALTAGNPNGFGFPAPDSYMVIIQSIGVPFGRSSLYDKQSIMDLEKLINNLGGSEYAFHAIFENPGTPPNPNKYSMLGIAKNDLSVTMPTMPTLGPTESVEASTLKLQDGTWIVSGSDGNVRGVINKNRQGMYVPFLASEGVPGAELSLPVILFQNPTPWITGPAAEDPTPYLAAYSWISTYITGAPPQNSNGACSTPGAVTIKGGTCGDLRTYYPTIDNLWNEVGNMLYGLGAMDTQANMFCQSASGKGSDFNCDQYQWMKDQLYREVQKVEVAKELFQHDIGDFYKALATYQSLSLSEFYANAYNTLGIDPQSPNPTQSILNIVQSVFTRASLMGLATGKPAVAVIGGIASAAVAVASHFIPDSNANPVAGVISTTIEDLWQDLTTNFLTEDFVARKSYELVVSDWGKLQAAENLWNQWNTDTTEEALASMIVGFEAYLYKILIPLAYQVEKLPGTQCSTLTDFETCSKSWNTGNECDYYGHHAGVPLPNYVALASQAWDPLQARQANDLYWVYKGNHTTGNFSYIPKTTLDNIFAPFNYYDLTKLGVSKVDFFTRWPFTYSDCPLYEDWCYTCGELW